MQQTIWTKSTRAMHWILAICIIINLVNDGDDNKQLHRYAGYIALAVLALRMFYGFAARSTESQQSQFRHWPLHPQKLVSFLKGELNPKLATDYEGHNPLASYVYIGIWLCVLALGITGYMMEMDAFWGEEWVEELHGAISWGLRVGIILHFVGIAKDSFVKRRKTFLAMITGKR